MDNLHIFIEDGSVCSMCHEYIGHPIGCPRVCYFCSDEDYSDDSDQLGDDDERSEEDRDPVDAGKNGGRFENVQTGFRCSGRRSDV